MKQHSTDFAGPSISHFGPPLSPDTVYSGTPGNDTIIGTETNDFFNMTDGGSDWVYGLKGNDVFAFGATLNPGDRIDGGEGYDSVLIGGTYPLGIHPGATTLINVEELDFDSQYSYAITMNDGNVGPKDTLVVNAILDAPNSFQFDGSAEKDGSFEITSGTGDDVLTGGAQADTFHLEHGGNDTVKGGPGMDSFYFGGSFTANDRVDGGIDSDEIILDGNYTGAHAITFQAATMKSVEIMDLAGGHNYSLTLNDGNIAAGQTLSIARLSPQPGDTLTVDASAETNGSVIFVGGPGKDIFTGASGSNTTDGFVFKTGDLQASDRINGGSAGWEDQVNIDGDYSSGITLADATIRNISWLNLDGDYNYKITMADGNVAAGATMTVYGWETVGHKVTFDASAESDGQYEYCGHDGRDIVTGGQLNDHLIGGGGADHLTGGSGDDLYDYFGASDSTGTHYDTITGFDFLTADLFVIQNVAVQGINKAVKGGPLSTATFNTDLAAAVNAAHLGNNDAVLFIPNGGTLKGDIFLVVDGNHTAGYQAGKDFVFLLDNPLHLTSLDKADFIT